MNEQQESSRSTSQPESSSSAVSQESQPEDSDSSVITARTPSPVNLLDRLRSPTQADLSRKRKTPSNPPKGLKRSKGDVASEPSVATTTRVKEFPGEHLSVVCGKLFCNACREPVSVKKSVIILHIKSAKHAAGIQRLTA